MLGQFAVLLVVSAHDNSKKSKDVVNGRDGKVSIDKTVSFRLTFYFQVSEQGIVSGVVPSTPPGTCLQLLSRIGLSTPTARRFPSNVANSRSRAFRESNWCTRTPYEKKKKHTSEYALGETRTHAIDLGIPGTLYN